MYDLIWNDRNTWKMQADGQIDHSIGKLIDRYAVIETEGAPINEQNAVSAAHRLPRHLRLGADAVVRVEVWRGEVLRAEGGEAALPVERPAAAGPPVLHGPRVGVAVRQTPRQTGAGPAVQRHRFGDGLPLRWESLTDSRRVESSQSEK